MANTLFTRLAGLVGDFGRARDAAFTYERLNALSDGKLAARGLTRGDLPAEAMRRAGL